MEFPKEYKYTKEHEWVFLEEENIILVGITDYAQEELGDIVYIELPEEGAPVKKGEAFGVVESVKAVSDIYSPVSGKVIELNTELAQKPEIINEDPYGEGWMIRVEISDKKEFKELLNAQDYSKYVEEERK